MCQVSSSTFNSFSNFHQWGNKVKWYLTDLILDWDPKPRRLGSEFGLFFVDQRAENLLAHEEGPGHVEAALVGSTLEGHLDLALSRQVSEPLAVLGVDELKAETLK